MKLPGFLSQPALARRLRQQERELKQLRAEVATLRAQNDSMRSGMRRCITCEYRLEAKARN